MYYRATTFLRDTFTYFNYFSIRDSLRVQHLFLQIKDKGMYLLYTRISRKSQVNSLTANARFFRNIGTRFKSLGWIFPVYRVFH